MKKILITLLLLTSLIGLVRFNRVEASSVDDYYQDVDLSLYGEDFIDMLTPIINDGFVSYSYSQIANILKESDADPNKPGNIICFYTGQSLPSGAWNKEHVWAKSHGFPESGKDAYSDAHHLRPTANSINSSRGNSDFDEVDESSSYKSDNYGNKWTNTIFEPRDEVKGDVARIMFYMVVKYNNVDNTNLELVNTVPTSSSSGEGRFGNLSTLLKWNYEDPVSDFERHRNEVVYSYQKNRNPFIDHPEYVEHAFPNEYANQEVDETKVNNVIDLINTIPSTITLDNKALINSIKDAYAKLNYSEQALVTNYNVLKDALTTLASLEGEASKPTISGDKVVIDFANHNVANSNYASNVEFKIGDYPFLASNMGVYNKELRIGTNKKTSLPAKYNLEAGDATALEMNFEVANLSGMSLEVLSNYGTLSKWYILFKASGSETYEIISEGSGSQISASLNTPQTGSFTVVFSGSTPRVILGDYTLYMTTPNPYLDLKTEASVNFTLDDKEITAASIRFGGRFAKDLFKDASSFGVLAVESSNLAGKKFSDYYNGTSAKEYIASLASLRVLAYDATSMRASVDESGNVLADGNYYQFGLVINNVLGHEKEDITAVIYVEIAGQVYFMNETTYSLASILEATLNSGNLNTEEISLVRQAISFLQ